jgi:hypothetical protein
MKPIPPSRRDPEDWKGIGSVAISLLALTVSAISAYFAVESARISRDSTLVSRRPILAIDNLQRRDSTGFTRFVFKNGGGSPALSVIIQGKTEVILPNQEPEFDRYEESEFKGIVGTGQTVEQGIREHAGQGTRERPLSDADLKAIQDQRELLYVHGRVKYADMWGQNHWLKFCYKLNPQLTAYYACLKYNSIDNENPAR